MTVYENAKYGMKPLPSFQDGDVIKSGNFSQKVQTEITANLTIDPENAPLNMTNCVLSGDNTIQGSFNNSQRDFCYWLHTDMGLQELPTYSGQGATCGPDVDNCRHVNPAKVDVYIIDGVETTVYDNAREDGVI